MDQYRELENLTKSDTTKVRQQKFKIAGQEESKKYPYKNTCHKTVGEYFPTINDKINVSQLN